MNMGTLPGPGPIHLSWAMRPPEYRRLNIKVYEALVRPILPMISCQDFRQPSWQFFHFV